MSSFKHIRKSCGIISRIRENEDWWEKIVKSHWIAVWSVLFSINTPFCVICVFLCQSYLFDENMNMNESGSFQRAYSYCRWGLRVIFLQKHESFCVRARSTVTVPQRAMVYVMQLHLGNFRSFMWSGKIYLWVFMWFLYLNPLRCVKPVLNH